MEDENLFPSKLLDLDIPLTSIANYHNGISPGNLPAHLELRPLRRSDYDNGYLDVLRCLTDVGDVSHDNFTATFDHMKSSVNTYFIVVIFDANANKVVATATLILEYKFYHECSKRGHIEDVVVLSSYQGQQLGKILVDVLIALGKSLGTYKITLDCTMDKEPFYNKLGFKFGTHCLQKRFE